MTKKKSRPKPPSAADLSAAAHDSTADLRSQVRSLERRLRQSRTHEATIIEAVQRVLSDAPPRITPPPRPRASRRGSYEEIPILHLSDTQLGKTTPTYDTQVCEARVLECIEKTIQITNLRRSMARIHELRIYLGGDMVEGEDIFPHQAHEIDSSVFDQAVLNFPRIAVKAILRALEGFDRVRVSCVSGNHGRNGPRNTRAHPRTNWDTVAYEVTKAILLGTKDNPRTELAGRLTFDIADDFYVVDRVFDWGNLMVHGHQIGGGFAGFPWYGCVPDDHEILTREGWKRRSNLQKGEEVLTFHPRQQVSQWEPVQAINTFQIEDTILSFSRPGGHQMSFTRDHKWPTMTGELVPACHLDTADWLPIHGPVLDYCDSILDDRQAAILGWVVTDGTARWIGSYWEAGVYQSPKKHLEAVVSLLGTAPREPRADGKDDVQFVPLSLTDSKAISAVYREKSDLPRLVSRLSRSAAEAMFQAMLDAEGSSQGRSESFCQKPGPVADAFQILSVMVGRTAWRNIDSEGFARIVPRVGAALRPTWGEGMSEREFKGTVWCPTTPSGTWWVRSPSGMVMPTGNTAKKAWGWIDTITEKWDNLLFGHFHTPAMATLNMRRFYANGTTESDNNFAKEQLAAGGEPCQRLLFMDADHGVVSDTLLYLAPRTPNLKR